MNVKCSIDVHIHDPSSTIRLQIFDHFVLRLFEWHAQYFLSNSVVHAFRCHQGHEFWLHVCRELHDIAVEGLHSAKTQLEAEGFLSNMKQLEFRMLDILYLDGSMQ